MVWACDVKEDSNWVKKCMEYDWRVLDQEVDQRILGSWTEVVQKDVKGR